MGQDVVDKYEPHSKTGNDDDQEAPPPEEVREHMHNLHDHLVDFELDEIISADEMGINYPTELLV